MPATYRTVLAYGLKPGINEVFVPDAPFVIVGCGVEDGRVVVWLEVDHNITDLRPERFNVVATGEAFSREKNFSRFVGTIPQGAFSILAYHVLHEDSW